jgi:aminoglycoside phosphotransferase (APT) family kinase protein
VADPEVTTADPLPDRLAQWIERVTIGRLVAADRRPGGARKQAWYVDVAQAGGEVARLFLHVDTSDPALDPWSLHREASVYGALKETGVPVPTLVAYSPELHAMLSVRLSGENWFSRIRDPDEQLSTAQDFMRCLANLHRLDPATLDLPGFAKPAAVPDLVRHELDEWEQILAARGGEPTPEIRLTIDWLRKNIPDYDGPCVLVQGDTGPGNFMFAGGRVVAVVDWELSHLGDPMDDIAWLSLRAAQEPFTYLPDRLSEYEELSGHPLAVDRVRYYRVMAEAKLLVMAHRPQTNGAEPVRPDDIGNRLVYGMLHRRLWLEAFADFGGFELRPPEEPPLCDQGDHWLYASALAELRDVIVPRIDDPLARQRAKGLARVIKYLAEIGAHGAFFEACELDDLSVLLGRRPASVADGRAEVAAAVRTHAVSVEQYLQYLWNRTARDNELMRPASGVLADRHWPPVVPTGTKA